MIGNDMYAYCGSNPVNCCDFSGELCHYVVGIDTYSPVGSIIQQYTGGDGSCRGGIYTTTSNNVFHGEGELKDTIHDIAGGTSHGKILPWEYTFLSINEEGVTIVDASIALLEGTYQWSFMEVTPYRFFSAEASAGLTSKEGLHIGAMASMLSPSVDFTLGPITFSITGYIGAVGFETGINFDGFVIGFSNGLGGSLSVKWDN